MTFAIPAVPFGLVHMKKLFLLSSLLLIGCGPRTATVEGVVSYKKAPLPTGEIHFIGADGKSRSSPIGSDGSYKILDCPIGQVKVAVVAQKAKTAPLTTMPPEPMEGAPESPPPEIVSLIPSRYGDKDTSGLLYEIIGGRLTIAVDLKE